MGRCLDWSGKDGEGGSRGGRNGGIQWMECGMEGGGQRKWLMHAGMEAWKPPPSAVRLWHKMGYTRARRRHTTHYTRQKRSRCHFNKCLCWVPSPSLLYVFWCSFRLLCSLFVPCRFIETIVPKICSFKFSIDDKDYRLFNSADSISNSFNLKFIIYTSCKRMRS
jgi:hypothetical protein